MLFWDVQGCGRICEALMKVNRVRDHNNCQIRSITSRYFILRWLVPWNSAMNPAAVPLWMTSGPDTCAPLFKCECQKIYTMDYACIGCTDTFEHLTLWSCWLETIRGQIDVFTFWRAVISLYWLEKGRSAQTMDAKLSARRNTDVRGYSNVMR
jgi:hypothetical protein